MTDEGMNIELLMLEKLTGVISEEDDRLLTDLLLAHAAYRNRYEALRSIYEKEGSGHFLDKSHKNNAWTNVREKIELNRLYRKKKARIRRTAAMAMAMALLVLAAGWYLWNNEQPPQHILVDSSIRLELGDGQSIVLSGQVDSVKKNVGGQVQLNMTKDRLSYSVKDKRAAKQYNTLEVPLKQTYQLVLSDGTEVWLNAKSSLKFPFAFSDSAREVYLNGEAYFKVAKDAHHPFIVHTAHMDIQDLGTAFDVNAYDASATMTSLVEGLVVTYTKDGLSKKLVPGQQATFQPGKGFVVQAFDVDSLLSWRSGIYYFNHTPLEQIRPVIYRWFGKDLVFNNPELSDYTFTGALFKDKSIREFLDNLSITANIGYELSGEKIFLDHKKDR